MLSLSHPLSLVALLVVMLLAHGCGKPVDTADAEGPVSQTEAAVATDANPGDAGVTKVEGTINGTKVTLLGAELDDQLAIYEEDGWGFSPSLLIFFLGEGSHSGRQIIITNGDRADGGTTPHVHYRWRNADGDIETEIVMNNYDMTIQFGQENAGKLPGKIEFTVPGKQTSVKGSFVATVK